MIINNTKNRFARILKRDKLFYRPEVIPNMQIPGWLYPAEYDLTFHGLYDSMFLDSKLAAKIGGLMAKNVGKEPRRERVYVLLHNESRDGTLRVIGASVDGEKVLREAKKLVEDANVYSDGDCVEVLVFINGQGLSQEHDFLEVTADIKPSARCVFGTRLLG